MTVQSGVTLVDSRGSHHLPVPLQKHVSNACLSACPPTHCKHRKTKQQLKPMSYNGLGFCYHSTKLERCRYALSSLLTQFMWAVWSLLSVIFTWVRSDMAEKKRKKVVYEWSGLEISLTWARSFLAHSLLILSHNELRAKGCNLAPKKTSPPPHPPSLPRRFIPSCSP